ncbi:MAG: DNA primase [Caulobacterales bacterium 68-7]|nr:MAG: DNA primase [Caulobacterales bacterium 68-7]
MRYSDAFLEDLKSRLRLSDVIGKTVKLKRAGREYVGLSPFNKEKSPSFYVNDEKGFFHDFSSGKHGDLIAFYQETERLSFVEAIERMAAEAGVALPDPDPQSARQEEKRQGLVDWLALAAKWFESELRRPGGQAARDYLERRGLPSGEWARFGIGFAPGGSRTGLKDYLVAKGAKPADLVEAGLLIAPEDGGAPYDRFRDRIIFPITDTRGRPISFGGRAMDPNARAKYLNGPDSPLFDKGRTLYGLFEARKVLHAAGDGAPLVVVEGYMDVIACQRAGIAAVAPMGTALTEGQMELLWRLHGEPTLCFDGDNAGRRAAGRSIDRALPLLKPGRSFRFALVKGGKDPDDVLREQGAAALKAQVADTTPFVEQLFERERETKPLDTPEQKTDLKVRLRQLASTIADGDLAKAYKEDLLSRFEQLWKSERPVYEQGSISQAAQQMSRRRWDKNRRQPLEPATREGLAAAAALAAEPPPLAAALVVAAVRRPKLLGDSIEVIDATDFGDATLDSMVKELVALSIGGDTPAPELVNKRLAARGVTDDVFSRIMKAADRARADFLSEHDEVQAKVSWTAALEALRLLESAERAVQDAKNDLARDGDMAALNRHKEQRDRQKRIVRAGAWLDPDNAALH